MRYCSPSEWDISGTFYNELEDDLEEYRQSTRQGRPTKLKPVEEFFLVLCRLRGGFALQHLAHLFGVATSTISRIFTAWVNFMYLKFGQVNIWPLKM